MLLLGRTELVHYIIEIISLDVYMIYDGIGRQRNPDRWDLYIQWGKFEYTQSLLTPRFMWISTDFQSDNDFGYRMEVL